jgi:DNA-binding transcriptional MerR regulator
VFLDIPKKHWFKIGEVSRIVDVPPHVIRYWEQEFKVLRLQKTKSNQRIFERSDIETVAVIRILVQDKKFTIAGAEAQIRAFHARRLSFEQIVQALDGVLDAEPAPDDAPSGRADAQQLALPGTDFAVADANRPRTSPRPVATHTAGDDPPPTRDESDAVVDALRARVHTLETAERGKDDELRRLRDALASSHASADEQKDARTQMEEELASLRRVEEEQRAAIDRLVSELELAEASGDVLERLRAQAESAEVARQALEALRRDERAAAEQSRLEYEATVASLRSAVEERTSHATLVEARLHEVERVMVAREAECAGLREESAAVAARLQTAQQALREEMQRTDTLRRRRTESEEAQRLLVARQTALEERDREARSVLVSLVDAAREHRARTST